MSAPVAERAPAAHVLIHLHVPKCAGSSINFAMAQARRGRVLSGEPHKVMDRLSARTPSDNDALFDAVGGHFQWGVHRYFCKPYVYFSVIRDPIDRVCSFFNFVHATPSHPLYETFKAELNDINALTERFVQKTRGLWVSWSNYFCFAYAGHQRARQGERAAVEEHVANEIDAGRMLIGDLAAVTALLDAADLLPAGGLPALNAGPENPADFSPASAETLSSSVRDLLRHINEHDLALFAFLETTQRIATAHNVSSHPAMGAISADRAR